MAHHRSRAGMLILAACTLGVMHGQTPGKGGGTVGVTGKWAYSMQGRDGAPREVVFTLKQEGNTVTGSVPGMGRGGQGGEPTQITNGKVDGDKVTFDVIREFNGNKMITKYDGTVSGSEMKLKITRDTQNGPQTTEATAKKATT